MIPHKLKLMCTKYEENRCTHVEVISIIVGVIFWGSPCIIDKTMCEFSACVAFNKATNGLTDIKHEKGREKNPLAECH